MTGGDDQKTFLSSAPDLRGRHPREILEWAFATYGPRLMTTTAFGYSGMALLQMMSEVAPGVPVYFINTGFHFPETIQFRDYCIEKLKLNIIDLNPEKSRAVFLAEHGADVMRRDPDFCCHHNKVLPLKRLIEQHLYSAWIAALRRDQSKTREDIEIISPQPDDAGLVKIHPLAEWTKQDVWRYIREHDVPTHPLHDEGFMSIGCEPCTRATGADENERAGRWAGSGKTECGLHLMDGGLGI